MNHASVISRKGVIKFNNIFICEKKKLRTVIKY